jgi:hypothetical protein
LSIVSGRPRPGADSIIAVRLSSVGSHRRRKDLRTVLAKYQYSVTRRDPQIETPPTAAASMPAPFPRSANTPAIRGERRHASMRSWPACQAMCCSGSWAASSERLGLSMRTLDGELFDRVELVIDFCEGSKLVV